ncbi:MAG: helix-turn-helix domain-containing protein, partial [Thermotogaceae bacterium]|nr:helix-turn-helix domain-containing protein [Thermotogaceae bacterium]
ETAKLLQMNERTIREWVKTGKLKATKPGRSYFISEDAIRALIDGKGEGESAFDKF